MANPDGDMLFYLSAATGLLSGLAGLYSLRRSIRPYRMEIDSKNPDDMTISEETRELLPICPPPGSSTSWPSSSSGNESMPSPSTVLNVTGGGMGRDLMRENPMYPREVKSGSEDDDEDKDDDSGKNTDSDEASEEMDGEANEQEVGQNDDRYLRSISDLQQQARNRLDSLGLMVPFTSLTLPTAQSVGSGHFGKVYQGTLYRQVTHQIEDVAVKELQLDNSHNTERDRLEFLQEAIKMSRFRHENVLGLLAVTYRPDEERTPLIITPYISGGDLHNYIHGRPPLELVDLIPIARQIAAGMAHIHSHKFVHRDLAARNCLIITANNDRVSRVLVADFGLTRDVSPVYYVPSQRPDRSIPARWMPPESLATGKSTITSDVWSYGILLWEILTAGRLPYEEEIPDPQDLILSLINGVRLRRPPMCVSDRLWKLMHQMCWATDRRGRPSFEKIVKYLDTHFQNYC